MKKLLFIQPVITKYRISTFNELSKYYSLTIIYSLNMQSSYGDFIKELNDNIEVISLDTKVFMNKIFHQVGVLNIILSFKPDNIIIFANIRYISFWSTIFISKLFNIRVYPHGHGLFKKNQITIIYKLLYKIIFSFSAKYICYNNAVKNKFLAINININKLSVATNSLKNNFTIMPMEKKSINLKFLFLGRLREETNIEMLIKLIIKVNEENKEQIELNIIGDGEEYNLIKLYSEKYYYIKVYGAIYNQKKISDISNECLALIYPGNIGLSVVHAFSMSLPVVTHNSLYKHGPEASYITHKNGILLDESDMERSLEYFLENITDVNFQNMATESYKTYVKLTKCSLAMQMYNILEDIC